MKTVAELFESGEFTVGSLVEACGWNVEAAAKALDEFTEHQNMFNHSSFPSLHQPEGGGDQPEVWDGGFGYEDGQLWYYGSDGPSGGTKSTKRIAHADDVIEIL